MAGPNLKTSKLTAETATAFCEEWSAGKKAYRQITEEMRADGMTIWPADVTRWRKKKTPIVIEGEETTFAELFDIATEIRKEEIEVGIEQATIADIASSMLPGNVRTLAGVRMWRADRGQPKKLELSGEVESRGVTVLQVERDPPPQDA